jgi:hypothetical protein
MLIALAVTMVVTAGALTLALSSRKLFALDAARMRLNESIRGSRDFLTTDIRQAGERLTRTFPAIEIINGEDLPGGQPNDPDQLILRRNLLDTALRSCRDVKNNDRKIYLAELEHAPPTGCQQLPDSDGDGWPDNHQLWHDFRLTNGTEIDGEMEVPGYIFNPVTGDGEFFVYRKDDYTKGYIETPSGQDWIHEYKKDDEALVFLLEERRYQLDRDVMQLVVNQDDASPFNLVDGIENFQLRARFQIPPPPANPIEPPAQDAFGVGDDWTSLRAIEVTVRGKVPFGEEFIEREWSSEILPRNVLSR